MRADELLARVDAAYAELDQPSWPDPHSGREPGEGEYSRVSDPERYRVVHGRARAWARALADELGATVEPVEPDGTRTGGVRVTSPRPGTLPLLLLEHEVPTGPGKPPLPVLTVAVGDEDVDVEQQPDCGCDACDSGSDGLLEAVDDVVLAVVTGPYVALRHADWQAEWHPEGGGSRHGGRRLDHETAMDWCRRLVAGDEVVLPEGTTAYVGSSWLA